MTKTLEVACVALTSCFSSAIWSLRSRMYWLESVWFSWPWTFPSSFCWEKTTLNTNSHSFLAFNWNRLQKRSNNHPARRSSYAEQWWSWSRLGQTLKITWQMSCSQYALWTTSSCYHKFLLNIWKNTLKRGQFYVFQGQLVLVANGVGSTSCRCTSNGQDPEYLSDLLQLSQTPDHVLLAVPQSRLVHRGDRAFSVVCP